jgi:hypothetical protein
MCLRRMGIAVTVLVVAGTTGMGLAAAQAPGVAGRTTPAAPRSGGPRLSAEAAAIYQYVKKRPGELKWQRIPWLTDLLEAFRQAKAENRPVLLWATDDDPLDRC